ncbi:MAG: hydroxysqualene dehydroxylase HpnE [Bryobacteraceae bacterium]
MPSVIVAGGGLAGLAAAAALGSSGFEVDLFEARAFLGGRATSYAIPGSDGQTEVIDNCQHVLLRCCVNLIDLYTRLGVAGHIRFHREFFFIEPGGRVSALRAGRLPPPLHFAGSLLCAHYLSFFEKLALARCLAALQRDRLTRSDLDRITMLDWLRERNQPPRVIERFWRQVLVSAVNEDLERMAAIHGFQVLWLGFLARSDSYEMGIPAVPLGSLYSSDAWNRWPNVRIHSRAVVESIGHSGVSIDGSLRTADFYVSALPFERLATVAPGIDVPQMEHSPITGIHLWFDRPVTDLPHATLLDRTMQWMFNKSEGRHIQLVVSASRGLVEKSRNEIVALASRELSEFFPAAAQAKLLKAHVVKEVRATFSAAPGLEQVRPPAQTIWPNVFVAGDWTRSGWPATMEGAVRSGYIAAEAVALAAGSPRRYLLPDVA